MPSMRVLVTGGTGFVGGHVVAALDRAGHEVRLLVRRVDQVPVTLAPLGAGAAEVQVGDVTDPEAVRRALDGVDGVVHAAAVFSTDPRRRAEVDRTNATATRLVLEGAAERGLDPIVHISSTVALTRVQGSDPSLPLGDTSLPYAASKRDSELVARRLQEQGAAVTAVYPGAVLGPHDPYRGQNNEILRWVVRGRLPMWPRGGLHYVDVRDVAAVVTAVTEPGRSPGRYVVPGHHVDAAAMFGTVADVVGRRRPYLTLPAGIILPTTRVTDAAQRLLPRRWHVPADHEAVWLASCDTRMHDEPARAELGVQPRPFAETVRDTVAWMAASGRIPKRYAPPAPVAV